MGRGAHRFLKGCQEARGASWKDGQGGDDFLAVALRLRVILMLTLRLTALPCGAVEDAVACVQGEEVAGCLPPFPGLHRRQLTKRSQLNP